MERMRAGWRLSRLRREARATPDRTLPLQHCFGYRIKVTDSANFYVQLKDEFFQKIYHFEATRHDPVIIDGGSNVGMSILYFKRTYPKARITAFEPDPEISKILVDNLTRNGIDDVTVVKAALGPENTLARFTPDGMAGGHIQDAGDQGQVQVRRLSEFIQGPVDFLKLNIEGQEFPVLEELLHSGKLHQVRELVLEYHGWANGEQRLGKILELLDGAGYRYLVHDFDRETCLGSKPPFRITPHSNWFCLVYARRWDQDR
jgi:FkbM family methyltransferase